MTALEAIAVLWDAVERLHQDRWVRHRQLRADPAVAAALAYRWT